MARTDLRITKKEKIAVCVICGVKKRMPKRNITCSKTCSIVNSYAKKSSDCGEAIMEKCEYWRERKFNPLVS